MIDQASDRYIVYLSARKREGEKSTEIKTYPYFEMIPQSDALKTPFEQYMMKQQDQPTISVKNYQQPIIVKQENKIKKLKKNNVIKGSSIKLLSASKDDVFEVNNALLVNKKEIVTEQTPTLKKGF